MSNKFIYDSGFKNTYPVIFEYSGFKIEGTFAYYATSDVNKKRSIILVKELTFKRWLGKGLISIIK